jgi:GT2 family glycosyltransferase
MNAYTVRCPSVCCIVLNWNDPEETIACVESLKGLEYDNHNIVVVDNASTDKSVEILKNKFPDITILQNSKNTGYAAGNNIGIKWALENNAEYILVTNNDVIFDRYLLSEFMNVFATFKNLGVATGKVYYKNDPQRIYSGAGKVVRWKCSGVNRGKLFFRSVQHNTAHEVDYICGVLFIARSEVFKKVGLLDEKFFMYFEDLEFSRRVATHFLIYYTPRAIAYHKSGGGTRWSNYPDYYLYYHTRNRFWVFNKEPFIYRVYVAIFSTLIVLSKSIVIIFSTHENKSLLQKKLTALWRGFLDGMMVGVYQKQ